MAGSQDADAVNGWMCLASVGLVEDALSVTGEEWRAEAEIGVELAAARRAEDVHALVQGAARGPLVVDELVTVGDVLEGWVLDAGLVLFV